MRSFTPRQEKRACVPLQCGTRYHFCQSVAVKLHHLTAYYWLHWFQRILSVVRDPNFHLIPLIASLCYVSFAVHQQAGPSGFLSACNDHEPAPPTAPISHLNLTPIIFLNHSTMIVFLGLSCHSRLPGRVEKVLLSSSRYFQAPS